MQLNFSRYKLMLFEVGQGSGKTKSYQKIIYKKINLGKQLIKLNFFQFDLLVSVKYIPKKILLGDVFHRLGIVDLVHA